MLLQEQLERLPRLGWYSCACHFQAHITPYHFSLLCCPSPSLTPKFPAYPTGTFILNSPFYLSPFLSSAIHTQTAFLGSHFVSPTIPSRTCHNYTTITLPYVPVYPDNRGCGSSEPSLQSYQTSRYHTPDSNL